MNLNGDKAVLEAKINLGEGEEPAPDQGPPGEEVGALIDNKDDLKEGSSSTPAVFSLNTTDSEEGTMADADNPEEEARYPHPRKANKERP